jgi:hypothetical protein
MNRRSAELPEASWVLRLTVVNGIHFMLWHGRVGSMVELDFAVAGVVEQDRAIRTLVSAFEDDPVERWLYPDEAQYRRHFPAFVAAFGGADDADGEDDSPVPFDESLEHAATPKPMVKHAVADSPTRAADPDTLRSRRGSTTGRRAGEASGEHSCSRSHARTSVGAAGAVDDRGYAGTAGRHTTIEPTMWKESSAIEPMKASADPNAAPAAPMIMAAPRIIASHPNQRGSVPPRSAAADVASASMAKKIDA